MTKLLRYLFFLSLWSWSHAQSVATPSFDKIPPEFRSHPELGKTSHTHIIHPVEYELVHERTQYSRTFLNKNTTKTKVQSSTPLHYQDASGQWLTLDYQIGAKNGHLSYPAQQPFFKFSGDRLRLIDQEKTVEWAAQTEFKFLSVDNRLVKKVRSHQSTPIATKNTITFQNISENLHKKITLYQSAVKYDYQITGPAFLPPSFERLLIEEHLTLPAGFSIVQDAQRIVIRDKSMAVRFSLEQPVVSDSNKPTRDQHAPTTPAHYNLIKIDNRHYILQMTIDGDWLRAPG